MASLISYFTESEQANFCTQELQLVTAAKTTGDANEVFYFWAEKRKLFMQRAFERSMGVV